MINKKKKSNLLKAGNNQQIPGRKKKSSYLNQDESAKTTQVDSLHGLDPNSKQSKQMDDQMQFSNLSNICQKQKDEEEDNNNASDDDEEEDSDTDKSSRPSETPQT